MSVVKTLRLCHAIQGLSMMLYYYKRRFSEEVHIFFDIAISTQFNISMIQKRLEFIRLHEHTTQ